MTFQDNRAHKNSITLKNGQALTLSYIGAGGSCICYNIISPAIYAGQILKEFCPVDRFGNPLKDDDELYIIMKEKFFKMEEAIFAIKNNYKLFGQTVLITYEKKETISGFCYIGKLDVKGDTLKEHWENFVGNIDNKIEDLFKCISDALRDLSIYHSSLNQEYPYGILDCDFKPSNLWYAHITGKENYIISNLDFGSCINVKDVLDELAELEGDIESDGVKSAISKIKKQFFASTPTYYDVEFPNSDVNIVLSECYKLLHFAQDKETKYLQAAKYLRLLDLKAVITVFFERLWQIFNLEFADFSDERFKKLYNLIAQNEISKFKREYSLNNEGDANAFVRFYFVNSLQQLDLLRVNILDFRADRGWCNQNVESVKNIIDNIYKFFSDNENQLKKNLKALNVAEFSDVTVEDIFSNAGFKNRSFEYNIGNLLQDLLFED